MGIGVTSAVVDLGGGQYMVREGNFVYCPIFRETSEFLEIDKVLLISGGGGILVGDPYVKGAKVIAKILEREVYGDKVVVFKYKKRKGYKKKQGHRQSYAKLLVEKINF